MSDGSTRSRLFAFIHAFLISETERKKAIESELRKHESRQLCFCPSSMILSLNEICEAAISANDRCVKLRRRSFPERTSERRPARKQSAAENSDRFLTEYGKLAASERANLPERAEKKKIMDQPGAALSSYQMHDRDASVCERCISRVRVVIGFITMCNQPERTDNKVISQANELFKTLENRSVLNRIALLSTASVEGSARDDTASIYN